MQNILFSGTDSYYHFIILFWTQLYDNIILDIIFQHFWSFYCTQSTRLSNTEKSRWSLCDSFTLKQPQNSRGDRHLFIKWQYMPNCGKQQNWGRNKALCKQREAFIPIKTKDRDLTIKLKTIKLKKKKSLQALTSVFVHIHHSTSTLKRMANTSKFSLIPSVVGMRYSFATLVKREVY